MSSLGPLHSAQIFDSCPADYISEIKPFLHLRKEFSQRPFIHCVLLHSGSFTLLFGIVEYKPCCAASSDIILLDIYWVLVVSTYNRFYRLSAYCLRKKWLTVGWTW